MDQPKPRRNILRRFLHSRDSPPTIQTTDPLEKTCDICANDVPSSLFVTPHILPRSCRAHCSTICQDCISKSLAADIANKPIDRIGCPSCQQAWDRSLIDYYSTAELIVEYDSKALLQSLQTVPGFRFCLSPTCGGGQIHDGGKKEPIVTCADCGFRSCYTHRVPWHSGLSCAAFDEERSGESEKAKAKRLLKEEQDYQKIWGKGSRPCPRCKACIVKAGGCDHMRCTYLVSGTIISGPAGAGCIDVDRHNTGELKALR
ncbi:hypothetical protein G7Y79_00012g031820 [Physcia stellaris]|nr:hypothetical protein G7Y79_00012g031820 [Physcia stellaris]